MDEPCDIIVILLTLDRLVSITLISAYGRFHGILTNSVPRNFVSIPAKPNGKSNKIFLIATTLCFHYIKNLLHLGVKWLLVYDIFELILDFSAANYGLDKTFRYKSLSLDLYHFFFYTNYHNVDAIASAD